MNYVFQILLYAVVIILFLGVTKDGINKKLLIPSVVIGSLSLLTAFTDKSLIEAITGGILNFLLWYVLLTVVSSISAKMPKKRK